MSLDVEMDSDVNETAFSCISSQAKRAKLERVSLDVEMDSDVNENTSRGRYSYMRKLYKIIENRQFLWKFQKKCISLQAEKEK